MVKMSKEKQIDIQRKYQWLKRVEWNFDKPESEITVNDVNIAYKVKTAIDSW